TIGGPNLESRTPCRNAAFHWTTTPSPGCAVQVRRAADARLLGRKRRAPPAPAAARNRLRLIPSSSAEARGWRFPLGRSGRCVIDRAWFRSLAGLGREAPRDFPPRH